MGSPTGSQTVPLKTRFSDGTPATTAWRACRGHCFRGSLLAPLFLRTPTPQANEGSTDSYAGLEAPHQLLAVVPLTPRPTLHLLCLRPGCILETLLISLALSHRAQP